MDLISKKVSYLKGLAEGYGFNGEKDNLQHIVLSILDCLDLMAEEMNFLDSDFQRLEEYVEMVDEDLHDLEMIFDEDFNDEEFEDGFYDDIDWSTDEDWNVEEEE